MSTVQICIIDSFHSLFSLPVFVYEAFKNPYSQSTLIFGTHIQEFLFVVCFLSCLQGFRRYSSEEKKGGIHTNSWPSLLGLTNISYPPAGPIEAQTWTSEVIATRHDETKFGPDRQINGPRLKPRTKLLGHSWQWRRKYFFWGNAASRGVPYFMSLNVLHFLSLKKMLNSISFSLKKALLRWNTTKLCLHI